MAQKLTKSVVDKLEAETSRYDVFDKDLPGFHVRVTPDGVKTFFVRYRSTRSRGSARPRLKIGRYGELTVDKARDEAKKRLADVTLGKDPAAERRALRSAPSVQDLGDTYLLEVDARQKPKVAAENRRLWINHVLPALGRQLVTELTPAHVSKVHLSLKDTPYQANRVLALVGSFCTFAERQGVRPRHSNPVQDIKKFPEKPRERYLTAEEMRRLGEALRRAETEGLPTATTFKRKSRGISASRRAKLTGRRRGPYAKHSSARPTPANPYAVAAIRFLVLTGWRRGEALSLRWDYLSADLHTATLPDTKTGRSVRKIGDAARALLSELPRIHGSPWVFPGIDPANHLLEINRLWHSVREASGLTDVRLHDLRHSFASVAISSGESLPMIGKLLGHKQVSTTSRYAHLADDPLQVAANKASGQLATWLAHGAHTAGDRLPT